MSKPANYDLMAKIHRRLAEYIMSILDEAMREPDPDDPDALPGMPLDAATMGMIAKYLKDNDITADPADKDDINDLRQRFSKASQSKVAQNLNRIIDDAESSEYTIQ